MWNMTPQERLALLVTLLLLSAGVAVRIFGAEAGAAEWRDPTSSVDAEASGGVTGLRVKVEEKRASNRLRSTPLAAGERIDPNTASVDELQRLPRIGPALAARIVAHREANGPFGSLADLDAVSGIGPALLAGITPLVTLPPGAPVAKRVSGAGRGDGGAAPPANRSPPAAGSGEEARIPVNRATAEELQILPGIGPAIAERIVSWRAANGPFRTAEEMERVRGIGPVLRARLAPRLSFDP